MAEVAGANQAKLAFDHEVAALRAIQAGKSDHHKGETQNSKSYELRGL